MIGTISWADDPGLFKKASWEEEGKTESQQQLFLHGSCLHFPR